jgi:hypothetical protein
MSDTSPVNPVQPQGPSSPFDEAEFLRRTFDRSLAEMDRSRAYFETLFKRTTWAIGILVVLIVAGGGVLGFRSWSDVQQRMNDKLRETQGAIEARGQQAILDTDKLVRDRAEAAFKEENIKTFVRQVAKEKTEAALTGVIRQAVGEQVSARIKAEEHQITKTVIKETKEAVDNLSPHISGEVQKRTDAALGPLRQQIAGYDEIIRVSTLALLARNGDGAAYDNVERMDQETQNPVLREICLSTLNQIYVEANVPFYTSRHFTIERTVDDLKRLLDDPNPLIRWAAVDTLGEKQQKDIVPKLVDIINHDNSLWVRRAAYQALATLTGQNIQRLERDQWNKWWEANKGNWPPK